MIGSASQLRNVIGRFPCCVHGKASSSSCNLHANMNPKETLMNAMGAKLRIARRELCNGRHDPELMEKIDTLHQVIRLVTNFENQLLTEIYDID